MRAGWDLHICPEPETLESTHPIADAFWFRHPHWGDAPVPADYWDQLIPAVSNGAVAVFNSYWNMPLEGYFNDPSFKVSTIEAENLLHTDRQTTFIAPGDWGLIPYNISNTLARGRSPYYGFRPADPSAWTVLAIGNNGIGKDPIPYLLVRRYGRGLVVLGGVPLPAPAPEVLENLLQWNNRMRQTLPDGVLEL